MNKQAAHDHLLGIHKDLKDAQRLVELKLEAFAEACKSAYAAGLNDREIAESVNPPYSRARIQQFRMGDPRKRK